MSKPIIGITISHSEDLTRINMSARYPRVVERFGGLPLLLPEAKEDDNIAALCDLCDGILFSGGADLEPWRYGEEKQPDCGACFPGRDEFELKLLKIALGRKTPILGICRGIQTLNVGLGGTLYQHIPDHRGTRHTVTVDPGNFLYEKFGAKIETNSSHHQAIKQPGPGVRILAHAADGTVEAMLLEDYPFLFATQWHPEVDAMEREDPVSIFILTHFIEESGRLSPRKRA